MKIFRTGLILTLMLISACTEYDNATSPQSTTDTSPEVSDADSGISEDVEPPDPCLTVTISHPGWCSCNPLCCQAQLWFCPPTFGEPTYFKKEVIVDDNNECLSCQ